MPPERLGQRQPGLTLMGEESSLHGDNAAGVPAAQLHPQTASECSTQPAAAAQRGLRATGLWKGT